MTFEELGVEVHDDTSLYELGMDYYLLAGAILRFPALVGQALGQPDDKRKGPCRVVFFNPGVVAAASVGGLLESPPALASTTVGYSDPRRAAGAGVVGGWRRY